MLKLADYTIQKIDIQNQTITFMKKYVFSSFILLAPLVFGFILSMDIFVPDIPSIVTALHTTPDIAQITLSAFMLTLGIGQLILGPFSDQIGRYKVAIFSSLLYLLSSIACSYADTIYILILARIIQAIGACGMLVVAFAATRDQFNDKQAGQMYSLLNCCIGLSPLVAPIIGSYLNVYYGWRSAFWFLSIVALIIFIITLCFFKETLPKTKRLPITKQLITRYIQVLKNFCFIANVFLVVAGMSMFFTFFSFSPYILINILHKPESDFGFYFFLVGFTFFIGSYVSAYIIKRSSLLKVAMTGIIINLLAGLWMLSSYIYFWHNHNWVYWPLHVIRYWWSNDYGRWGGGLQCYLLQNMQAQQLP